MSSREKHVSVCCSTKASCCIVIVLNNPRCVWSKWIVCREHFILYIPLSFCFSFFIFFLLLFCYLLFFFSFSLLFSKEYLFILDRHHLFLFILYIKLYQVVYAQAVGLQHAEVFKLIAALQLLIKDICGSCGSVPCIEIYHEAIIIANSCTQ